MDEGQCGDALQGTLPTMDARRLSEQATASQRPTVHKNPTAPESQVSEEQARVFRSSLQKMQTKQQEMQQQIEMLHNNIRENEEIREHMRRNLLEKQMKLEELSDKYDAKLKNRDKLRASGSKTCHISKVMTEHFRTMQDAVNQMTSERDILKARKESNLVRYNQLKDDVCKILNIYGSHTTLNHQQVEREYMEYSHNINLLQEKYKGIRVERESQLEEIDIQMNLKQEQLSNAEKELSDSKYQLEEFWKSRNCSLQSLNEKRLALGDNIEELREKNENVEKILLDAKKRNFELKIAIKEKVEKETELAALKESETALMSEVTDLKVKVDELEENLIQNETTRSKSLKEQAENIEILKELQEEKREEFENLKVVSADQIFQLQNNLKEVKSAEQYQLSQLKTLGDKLNRILQEKEQIQQEVRSTDERNSELERQIILQKEENNLTLTRQAKIANWEGQIEVQLEEIKHLKSKLGEADALCEMKRDEVREFTEKVILQEDAKAKYEEKIIQLQRDIANFRADHLIEQENAAKLGSDDAIQEERIKTLQIEIDSMQTTLSEDADQNKDMFQGLHKQLNELQNKLLESDSQLCDARETLQCKEARCQHLTSEKIEISVQKRERHETIDQLKWALSENLEKCNQLKESTIISLSHSENTTAELQNINQHLKVTEKEKKECLSNKICQLQSMTADFEKIKQDLDGKLIEQSDSLASKETSLAVINSLAEKIEEEMKVKEISLREVTNEVEQQEEELSLQDLKLGELQEHIDKYKEEIIKNSKCLEELKELIESEKRASEATAGEASKIETELELLRKDESKAQSDAAVQLEIVIQDITKYRKISADRGNEISALNFQLWELQKKLGQEQKELKETVEKLKNASAIALAFEQKIDGAQVKLTHTKNELKLVRGQIKQILNEKSRSNKITERLQRGIAIIRAEKKKRSEELTQRIVPKPSEIDKLSTPVKMPPISSKVPTPSKDSPNVTPHSILKSSKPPTPQTQMKSVSFAIDFDGDSSSSSIILEPDDIAAIEQNPADAHRIAGRRREIQMTQKQHKKLQLGFEEALEPPSQSTS